MTVSFQLTLDEYRKTQRVHRDPGEPRKSSGWVWVGIGIVAASALWAIVLVLSQQPASETAASVILYANWVALALLFTFSNYLTRLDGTVGRWIMRFFGIIWLGTLFICYQLLRVTSFHAVDLVAWIVCLMIYISYYRHISADYICLTFASSPLQLPQTLTWDDERLVQESEHRRETFTWAKMITYRESEDLILLYWSRSHFWILPKRALDESARVDLDRLLARRSSRPREPLHAFPVIQKDKTC